MLGEEILKISKRNWIGWH